MPTETRPGFSTQRVVAELRNSGLLKSNKFQIQLPSPKGLSGTPVTQRLLSTAGVVDLYAEGAPVPGVAMLTHDIRRYGYGASEKNAVLPIFMDWPTTIRLDGAGFIHDYFRQWMRMINNFELAGADANGTIASKNGAIAGQRVYETAFKDDYVVDGMITTYADDGSTSIQIMMRDLFPVHIGEVTMDWSRTNDYARLPVTFAYTDWSSTAAAAVNPSNQSS
jgi:hypothetical protein